MSSPELIGVRHLRVDGRCIPVLLFRNSQRSVAARCVFGARDMPIIDAATAEEAMETLRDSLEALLFARASAGV